MTEISFRRRYAFALGFLMFLFLGRVLIQLWQAWRPVGWLPPFESWHSATLPYPALVAAQVVVLALGAWSTWGIGSGRISAQPRVGRVLLVLGLIYFLSMAARLLLGLTLLHDIHWLDAPLPSVFHLVLATYLLVLSRFHLRCSARTEGAATRG